MDFVKKYWPMPFKVKSGDVGSLVKVLVVFLISCLIVGVLIGVLAGLPIIGIIFTIIGSLVEIYSIVGAILCVLKFLGTVK